MMRDSNDLQYFAAVVTNRGFSAAVRARGLPKSRQSLEALLSTRGHCAVQALGDGESHFPAVAQTVAFCLGSYQSIVTAAGVTRFFSRPRSLSTSAIDAVQEKASPPSGAPVIGSKYSAKQPRVITIA